MLLWSVSAALMLATGAQLWRRRRRVLDHRFTFADRHTLSAVAFYFVLPGVTAMTLGLQVLAARLWQVPLTRAVYWVFSHDVVLDGATLEQQRTRAPELLWRAVWVQGLGTALPVAIAFGLIVWTRLQAINGAANFLRLHSARLLLALSLWLLPLLSLVMRDGQTWSLYTQLWQLQQSAAYAFVTLHLLGAAAAWWFWQRRGRRRFARLASPLFDRLQLLKRGLARDPNNGFLLRELGRTYLAADAIDEARAPLEQAAHVRPEHPETRFLAGLAALRAGVPALAAKHLRSAGKRLQDAQALAASRQQRDLLYEVTLTLAASRLELEDAEGAALTAEAAQAQKPGEPRSLVLLADACKAMGELDKAKRALTRALRRAEGLLAREIRRRLREVERALSV